MKQNDDPEAVRFYAFNNPDLSVGPLWVDEVETDELPELIKAMQGKLFDPDGVDEDCAIMTLRLLVGRLVDP